MSQALPVPSTPAILTLAPSLLFHCFCFMLDGYDSIRSRSTSKSKTKRLRLSISHLPSSIFQNPARVVKWQTRTFEGRMPKGMRVQVPPRAVQRSELSRYGSVILLSSFASQMTSPGKFQIHRALRWRFQFACSGGEASKGCRHRRESPKKRWAEMS